MASLSLKDALGVEAYKKSNDLFVLGQAATTKTEHQLALTEQNQGSQRRMGPLRCKNAPSSLEIAPCFD